MGKIVVSAAALGLALTLAVTMLLILNEIIFHVDKKVLALYAIGVLHGVSLAALIRITSSLMKLTDKSSQAHKQGNSPVMPAKELSHLQTGTAQVPASSDGAALPELVSNPSPPPSASSLPPPPPPPLPSLPTREHSSCYCNSRVFSEVSSSEAQASIVMSVDEFESLRSKKDAAGRSLCSTPNAGDRTARRRSVRTPR
eukprot:4781049-Pleurochrysis_carterae.AAC.7